MNRPNNINKTNKLIAFVMLMSCIQSVAQNLIRNSDFEVGNFDCQESSFLINPILDHWSRISLLPIFHRQNCSFVGNQSTPPKANNGKGHLGIQGNAWVTGYIDGSVVLGALTEPLEKDEVYQFTFFGKSTGLRQDDEFQSKLCPFSQSYNLTFHLGTAEDTFRVEKVFDDSTLFLIATQPKTNFYEIPFSTPIPIESSPSNWQAYSTCFISTGEESQIAIASPIRSFEGASPCEVITKTDLNKFEGQRLHQIFSYELDDLVLQRIPKQIEAATTICANLPKSVNLLTYMPEDFAVFEEATFRWSDGSTQTERILEEEGLYNIDIILPCTTLPLQLKVTADNCPNIVYIPTAFSPNNDGVNDEFNPLFSDYYQLEKYQIEVYDRWGSRIFSSTNKNKGWNGRSNNRILSNGVFFYHITYKLANFEKEEQIIGTITLIN